MGLKERVIDVFEKRVEKLVKITDISELPQWTDADVIAADCLLKQWRNLTSQSSGRSISGCQAVGCHHYVGHHCRYGGDDCPHR